MANPEIRKWYALYTRPRWEKKVSRLVLEKGIEGYCPLNKVHRKWSDRIKVVEEPLFKSYVFVRLNDEEKSQVRMIPGIINFVYWLGKPAIIKDKEIQEIRKFLNEYEDVEVSLIKDLRPESEVILEGGILMGAKGIVKKVLRKNVEILIESIGFRLTTKLDKSRIRMIEK